MKRWIRTRFPRRCVRRIRCAPGVMRWIIFIFRPITWHFRWARKRLVFEELLILQLGLLRLKGRSRGETGAVIPQDYTAAYAQLLPYTLTGAQRRRSPTACRICRAAAR